MGAANLNKQGSVVGATGDPVVQAVVRMYTLVPTPEPTKPTDASFINSQTEALEMPRFCKVCISEIQTGDQHQ